MADTQQKRHSSFTLQQPPRGSKDGPAVHCTAPPERVITDILNEISNTTLEQNLYKIQSQLEDMYDISLSTTSHIELIKSIGTKLDKKTDLAELIISWENEKEHEQQKLKNEKNNEKKLRQENKLASEILIKYTTLYIELSRKAKSEGKVETAWAYACEANYCCGKITKKSTIELNALKIEETSRQNRENALNRRKPLQKVKDYAMELLKAKRPRGGWPTKQEAATAIEEDLQKFMNDKSNQITGITATNVKSTFLKRWAYHDEDIKRALEASLSNKIGHK